MGKGIFQGVSGVARKTKNANIGVSGVAREVKNGFIGVNGVARKFYQNEYVLYENGNNYASFFVPADEDGDAVFDTNAITFTKINHAAADNDTDTDGYIIVTQSVDLSGGYKTLNLNLEVTKLRNMGVLYDSEDDIPSDLLDRDRYYRIYALARIGNYSEGHTYVYSSRVFPTRTMVTLSMDISSINISNPTIQIAMQPENSSGYNGAGTYSFDGRFTKIWLE